MDGAIHWLHDNPGAIVFLAMFALAITGAIARFDGDPEEKGQRLDQKYDAGWDDTDK